MNQEVTGKKEKKKKSIVREVFGLAFFLILLFCLAWLLIHFVGERMQVDGESMYPVLSDGDQLIIDKVSYQFKDPKRFDVVVFPFQYRDGTCLIKRVIGLPGETVRITDGQVYINGRLLDDPYGYEPIRNAGLASGLVTLGKDEYFVLGDNRNNSTDSREPSIGNITRSSIIGRAWMRVWPLNGLRLL